MANTAVIAVAVAVAVVVAVAVTVAVTVAYLATAAVAARLVKLSVQMDFSALYACVLRASKHNLKEVAQGGARLRSKGVVLSHSAQQHGARLRHAASCQARPSRRHTIDAVSQLTDELERRRRHGFCVDDGGGGGEA